MLQQLWQEALSDSIKYWEKIVGNEIDTIGAFNALEVKKNFND